MYANSTRVPRYRDDDDEELQHKPFRAEETTAHKAPLEELSDGRTELRQPVCDRERAHSVTETENHRRSVEISKISRSVAVV